MHVSAKSDYAVRAAIELAAAADGPVKGERIAEAQQIPIKFLENILSDLRSAGHLVEVWIAVRVALRGVLERVTLADLIAGSLPASVRELIGDADAWASRSAGGHTPPVRRAAAPR